MTANLKLANPAGYRPLTTETAAEYLGGYKDMIAKLGGAPEDWKAREVGDGNLNLVFIIEGPDAGVVIKQALPYVRLVGESWPLPLARAHYEHLALKEQAQWAYDYVPEIYHHDAPMALTVMEYLAPHIILRKGLVRGTTYPNMAKHLGAFLARTHYHTSDLHLNAVAKKEKIAQFLFNTAMCKISEDLLFDEPYFDAPLNRHTPQLADVAAAFKKDVALKAAAQDMKWRFQNRPEAMIHGDLHTGSVMVTEKDTRVIDPEFAFYGPIGFDVGAIIGNLFIAYFAQTGHEKTAGERKDYAEWIIEQARIIWDIFAQEFTELCRTRCENTPGGDIAHPRLYKDTPSLPEQIIQTRLNAIWDDALGFAGCKIIRRILGLAHVEDFESIESEEIRAKCETKALRFGHDLLTSRANLKNMDDVIRVAKAAG